MGFRGVVRTKGKIFLSEGLNVYKLWIEGRNMLERRKEENEEGGLWKR